MKEPQSPEMTAPAVQLMAVEVISELLASTSPQQLGQSLTEHLRELTGARTAMILLHAETPGKHELLTISPSRRNTLFSAAELTYFCPEHTAGELTGYPKDLPMDHPLREPLMRAGVTSIARYPLHAGGEVVGSLILLDLPGIERIGEVSEIITVLSPMIALAIRNALAYRQTELQAQELEQRVEERTAELREAQALLQIAIASSPIPIMIHDEDDRILQLSNGWTNLSGYTIEDIPTLGDWTERAYGESSGTKKEYIDDLFALDRTVNNGEWTVTAKDGSTRIWEFQTTPLGSVSKGKRVLLSMATDITERKTAEEEKLTLEGQLQQAQKMESVGRLAGGVAHDFNNMLSVILGHADMALMASEQDQPLHTNLEEIRKAAERSADLTRQLLAFARKQTIAPKVLNLNETVAGMLKMLQRLIGEDTRLTWQPAPNLWPVKIDPSQIDQILANLCVNARDSIADVGKITIETGNSVIDGDYCAHHVGFVAGEYVQLTVSDNGCGMNKETLAHVFEPFFTTKGVGEGTGLGLATVYGSVKQNNGFINVYSEPGLGTTFTIYLPRHVGRAEQARTATSVEPVPYGQETILLVEDEQSILNIATMMLTRQGYTVLPANTTAEAIRLAGEYAGKIHLLMTDVVMPGMNGRDLADNLLSLCPQLKCLFMSGYTADVVAHRGVLDADVQFIHKPFTLSDLAAKVRDVLDGN